MVIEFLKIQVQPNLRQKYVEAEQQIWTTGLSQCEGFINKEIWLDPEEPSTVYIRILWNSYAQWKAIPADYLEKLDAALAERIGPIWQIVESKEYLPVLSVPCELPETRRHSKKKTNQDI